MLKVKAKGPVPVLPVNCTLRVTGLIGISVMSALAYINALIADLIALF
jgi:hypothetical protein